MHVSANNKVVLFEIVANFSVVEVKRGVDERDFNLAFREFLEARFFDLIEVVQEDVFIFDTNSAMTLFGDI